MSEGNPLNETLRQEVLAVDGVTDVIENRQAVHVRFENEESSSGGMCDLLSDRNRDQMEAALVCGLCLKIPIVLHWIWNMRKIWSV